MSKNTAFAVIPNWNGKDMIADCINSLKKQTVKLQIVVVDNGSTDGSVPFIKDSFPDITLVELQENTGFTGGVNIGIERALEQGVEYILLFNNDAVADKDWAARLIQAAKENPEAGIVTGKFMRLDKVHLDSTGDFYTVWGLPFPRGRNQLDSGQYEKEEWVFGATGGASLYKAEMLKQIGLFDQDFFAYYEDVDISFRAQMAGWKVRYTPDALAYHHVGGTSSKMGDFARYHSAKNFLLVYARNMPLKLYVKYIPLFTLQFLRMGLTSLLRRKFTVFLKGTWAAIMLHKSNVKKRSNVQKNRKVSVDYIDSILTHSRPPRIPVLKD